MNLAEKIVRAYQNNEPMPLKGHTKITLTDIHTGNQEVIEKDNMVTNAVADILAKNWCGLANFSTLLPLKNLFSGVICFEGEITEDADGYTPPNDGDCEQVCHAGDEAHTTAEAVRGQPNIAEQVVTDTSIKQVWDFSTSVQGEIRTVCLVPGTFGNMGTKPYTTTYSPIKGFGDDRSSNPSWGENTSKQYPFTIASDGKTCKTVYADGTTFKEYTMRHDFFAFGIMRGSSDWQDVSNRTATIESFNDNKSFIFDDDSNYYIGKVTGATTLQLETISKVDMTVTTSTLTFTGVSLYTGNLGGSKNKEMRVWAFDGTYLYLPNGDGNKFYGLNISNTSDVLEMTETITIHKGQFSENLSGGQQFMTPIALGEKFVIGDNYVLNNGHAYQTAQVTAVLGNTGYAQNNRWLDAIRMGSATYGHAYTSYSSGTAGQGCILNSMMLTTINVLDSVVNKTSSTTMKIEYTLTEV